MAQEAHDADPTAATAAALSKKKNRLAATAAASNAATSSSASAAPPIEYLSFCGSRYVRPYSHSFSFSVKQRWWGRPLLSMLCAEYKNPLSGQGFYERMIRSGRVHVLRAGNKAVSESGEALLSRIVQPNDRVTLQLHRHEPPVPDSELSIVHHQTQHNTNNEETSSAPSSDDAAASSAASSSSSSLPAESSPHCSSSSASASAAPPLPQPLLSLASETLVVSKPAGLPVHASGRYQWNTVVGLLKQRFGIEAFPVHRLDRVTSGLLLLSLTRSNARALSAEISDRLVSKRYVARVRGHFLNGRTEPVRVEADIELRGGDGGSSGGGHTEPDSAKPAKEDSTQAASDSAASVADAAASLPADRSVAPLNPFMSARVPARVQTNAAASSSAAAPATDDAASTGPAAAASAAAPSAAPTASVKSACTEFQLLSFDGCSSLVSCRPLHGRTHQIRVHLRSLGHPIANDYLYGGTLLESNAHVDRSDELWRHRADKASADAEAAGGDAAEMESARQQWIQPGCMECETRTAAASAAATSVSSSDPVAAPSSTPAAAVYCHSIWLHCASYSSSRWSYEAPLPHWARDGFDSAAELSRPCTLPTAAMGAAGHREGADAEEDED